MLFTILDNLMVWLLLKICMQKWVRAMLDFMTIWLKVVSFRTFKVTLCFVIWIHMCWVSFSYLYIFRKFVCLFVFFFFFCLFVYFYFFLILFSLFLEHFGVCLNFTQDASLKILNQHLKIIRWRVINMLWFILKLQWCDSY